MLCNAHDDMSNFSIRSKHQRCYISDGFDEINDPNEISMLVKQRNVVIGENVPPIEEQVAYNPEYFVDFTYPDPDDF